MALTNKHTVVSLWVTLALFLLSCFPDVCSAGDTSVSYALVERLFKQLKMEQAEEKAYELYLQDSEDAKTKKLAFATTMYRSSQLYKKQEYEPMLEVCRRASLYKSSDYRSAYYRGLALKGLKRLDEAADSLKEAWNLCSGQKGKKNISLALGDIYYKKEVFDEALTWYRERERISGRDEDLCCKIGTCLWRSGDTSGAVDYLKDARLDFINSSTISRLLKRLERENSVEEDYRQVISGDFFISFERTQEQSNLKDRMARMLATALSDVERNLWRHNGNMIHVVLYPSGTKYAEALNAPNWSAACWNGKLRIPVETVRDAREEKLLPLLRHELVHFILREKYKWKPLPSWIDEGLAQINEGEEKHWARNLLRPIVNRRDSERYLFSFKELEPGFSRIRSGNSARVAYAQALWAVKYLTDTRWSYPVDILDYISEGYTPEEALYRVTGEDYKKFTDSWMRWLRKKFKLRQQ